MFGKRYLTREMLFREIYSLNYKVVKQDCNRYEVEIVRTGEVIAKLNFENRKHFVDVGYPRLISLLQNYCEVRVWWQL